LGQYVISRGMTGKNLNIYREISIAKIRACYNNTDKVSDWAISFCNKKIPIAVVTSGIIIEK
jgi:hypothetical protein